MSLPPVGVDHARKSATEELCADSGACLILEPVAFGLVCRYLDRKFNKLVPAKIREKGNYLCDDGHTIRPITTTVSGKTCKAIFPNSKNGIDILHESKFNPNDCAVRAAYYADINFKNKRIRCVPNW